MRVYNRTDFLKLPEGTLYCAGEPWAFGELSVKADTLECNDFVCRGLQWIESGGTAESMERLDEMLATGASYGLQESYGRDGGFDDTEIYLVYENADLDKLIEICQTAKVVK